MPNYQKPWLREIFDKYLAPPLAVALVLRLLWLAWEWVRGMF